MRLPGTQVNWDSKDINTLNDELFATPGSFDAYRDSWQRIGTAFAEIGRYLDASLRGASAAHEGEAADAGREVVDSLARYAVQAQQCALAVRAAVDDQAGYRADALTGLPEKLDPPSPADLLDPRGIPGGVDIARRVAEFDEQTQKARQVMRTYETSTNALLARLPQFPAPPRIAASAPADRPASAAAPVSDTAQAAPAPAAASPPPPPAPTAPPHSPPSTSAAAAGAGGAAGPVPAGAVRPSGDRDAGSRPNPRPPASGPPFRGPVSAGPQSAGVSAAARPSLRQPGPPPARPPAGPPAGQPFPGQPFGPSAAGSHSPAGPDRRGDRPTAGPYPNTGRPSGARPFVSPNTGGWATPPSGPVPLGGHRNPPPPPRTGPPGPAQPSVRQAGDRQGFGPMGSGYDVTGGAAAPHNSDFGPSGSGFGPSGGGYSPARPAAEPPQAPVAPPAAAAESAMPKDDTPRGHQRSYLVEADDGYGSGMMVAPPVLGE